MRTERARLSRPADTAADVAADTAADTAKAIDYKAIDDMVKPGPAFTRFLDDGQICLTNNAAERAVRGIAIGRRAR